MMPGQGMPMPGGGQMIVLNKNMKRESGRKAQMSNITAATSIASIVRSTLGPKSMLKMLLDPMGSVVMTNDGHCILREVDAAHPAAKNMIELARSQDEEVGDGTTTVIILAGEMMSVAAPLLDKQIHPIQIVQGYLAALNDATHLLDDIAIPVDTNNMDRLKEVVTAAIGTKFVSRWGDLIVNLAIQAALTVYEVLPSGKKEIDLKRYAKVEKIAGGDLEDCCVLQGVMFNKDITHPKMRRKIKNPRVVLLDCPLEYKKGESQTNVEMTKEEDWELMLRQEEEEVKKLCDELLRVKPDVVITEKGVSDLAQHFLLKQNVSCIRRLRKTDNNRVARITGATIVNRVEELQESDVGTACGLFEVKKIGEEHFTFMTECENPKACSILLRGATKDVLNEIERNLHDAFNVSRNVLIEPKLLPGGGCTEMHLAMKMKEKGKHMEGVRQHAYLAVASAFEVIPRALAANCGCDVIRVMTDLRAAHNKKELSYLGIDGDANKIVDVKAAGINDTFTTKVQAIKAAIETAAMLLRIDDIVSGTKGGLAASQQKPQKLNPNDDLQGEGGQV